MKEKYYKIVNRFLDHLNSIDLDRLSMYDHQAYADTLIRLKALCDPPDYLSQIMTSGIAAANGFCACKQKSEV